MYLEQRGEDLSSFLEKVDFPQEFLRDPSYWVDADQLEHFLLIFSENYKPTVSDCLVCDAAAEVHKLRSWGVLDSVLRMMPRPQEIMNQPEKFLSYFISPLPPISEVRREENRIEFNIQDFSEQFPLTTKFLVKAFSTLPCFVGLEAALCKWQTGVFKLQWSEAPLQLATNENSLGHQLTPELLQSVINQLETNQRELEKRNQDLVSKNKLIEDAHRDLQATLTMQVFHEKMRGLSEFAEVISRDLQKPADNLAQQFLKMQDFMVRAQQVITVMKSSQPNSTLLNEALKRVDWDRAKEAFRDSLATGDEALEQIRHLSRELKRGSQSTLAVTRGYGEKSSAEKKYKKIDNDLNSQDQVSLDL